MVTYLENKILIIADHASNFIPKENNKLGKILVCGGGRKNTYLIDRIKSRLLKNLIMEPVDYYGIDGDFVEAQAFGYLAIRSFLEGIRLPLCFVL